MVTKASMDSIRSFKTLRRDRVWSTCNHHMLTIKLQHFADILAHDTLQDTVIGCLMHPRAHHPYLHEVSIQEVFSRLNFAFVNLQAPLYLVICECVSNLDACAPVSKRRSAISQTLFMQYCNNAIPARHKEHLVPFHCIARPALLQIYPCLASMG